MLVPDEICVKLNEQISTGPGASRQAAVKNIPKTLRRTKDMLLIYGGMEELSVKCYIGVKNIYKQL